MSIKEKFISDLIAELNRENESRVCNDKSPVDVCFVTSVVDQQLDNCKKFLDDITEHTYCINGYEKDTEDYYSNGKVRILIEKPESERESNYMFDAFYDYCYYIEFTEDERNWGYCQCSPGDNGFNEEHGCCGNGCDWHAPEFRIEKVISLDSGRWSGSESDYWEYKKRFESKEQNKNDEVEKYKIEEKRKYLQEQIADLKKKLAEL